MTLPAQQDRQSIFWGQVVNECLFGNAKLLAMQICDALEIDVDTLARGAYSDYGTDADITNINVSQHLMEARKKLRFRAAALEDCEPCAELPESEEQYDFGRAIAYFREEAGLTREALAERAGLYPDLISQWELRIRVPTDGQLLKLSEALSSLSDPPTSVRDFYRFPALQEELCLTDTEQRLIRKYRKASRREKSTLHVLLELDAAE